VTLRRNRISVALGAALLVLPLAAPVHAEPSGVPTAKYVDGQGARFESLAGSKENLTSLASGLRSGNEITLIEHTRAGPKATTFVPPTKPMGYGNVTRSLDLANRQLASLGITDPTAAQLKAALNGGVVTTARGDVRLDGVLALRSQGMGWGKIAHTVGASPSGRASATAATPGIVSATGAGRPHASGRAEAGRSSIVTASGGPASPSGNARGHGNAFGAAGSAPGAGIRGPMGLGGGNGHGHGRAGK
jgi:hypothetical protein